MRQFFGCVLRAALILGTMPAQAATLTTLVNFNFANGGRPGGGLIRDESGTFYGITGSGGPSGFGTVFSLSNSGTLTTLVAFNETTNGAHPAGSLIRDASGTLYGTTFMGGTFGRGTVFSLSSSGTFTTLLNFNGANGAHPTTSLLRDVSGTLYGVTPGGGAFGRGTVFSLTNSGSLTTLVNFDGTNGAEPHGNLISDGAGTFYGTTVLGGIGRGTVFSLTGDGTLTTLTDFSQPNGPDGKAPVGGLFRDSAGTLFGTTAQGGPFGEGTAFRINKDGTGTTLVYFYGGGGGGYPLGPLISDPSGMLYGTTAYGGDLGSIGTVFSLSTGGELTTLFRFKSGLINEGFLPSGSLFRDRAGVLYGTTSAGGTGDYGTVFKLTGLPTGAVPEPSSWAMLIVGFGMVGAVARRRKLHRT